MRIWLSKVRRFIYLMQKNSFTSYWYKNKKKFYICIKPYTCKWSKLQLCLRYLVTLWCASITFLDNVQKRLPCFVAIGTREIQMIGVFDIVLDTTIWRWFIMSSFWWSSPNLLIVGIRLVLSFQINPKLNLKSQQMIYLHHINHELLLKKNE